MLVNENEAVEMKAAAIGEYVSASNRIAVIAKILGFIVCLPVTLLAHTQPNPG